MTSTRTSCSSSAGAAPGLIEIQSILKGVPGISFVYFNEKDVVRHQLVSAIIRAWDAYEAGRAGPESETGGQTDRG